MRDTIASTLLSNGSTLDEVGYILGHEPGSPMMNRYAKFVESAQQRIVDRADELMKNKFVPKTKVEYFEQHLLNEVIEDSNSEVELKGDWNKNLQDIKWLVEKE